MRGREEIVAGRQETKRWGDEIILVEIDIER